MARTIQSPGVEINEIDLSLRPVTVEGTSVFVAGFSNQGPIDEIIQPTSTSEFEQIYGLPTNAAERYFYHSVKQVLNSSPGRVIVSRLPYGVGKGDGFSDWRYSALAYPVIPKDLFSANVSSFDLQSIFLDLSGFGYSTIPQVLALSGGGLGGTVLRAVTADDGLGNGTFGVSQIDIITKGDSEITPVIKIDPSFLLTSIFVSNSGSGYIEAPNVRILGGLNLTNSVQASAQVEMANDGIGLFNVEGITLSSLVSGSGYTSAPEIVVLGNASVSAAQFVAEMGFDDSGTGTFGVTAINMVESGFGYTEAPSLSFFGPTVGEIPFAEVEGTITDTFGVVAVNFTNFGKGYNDVPIIAFDGLTVNTEAVATVLADNGTPLAFAFGDQSVFEEYYDANSDSEEDGLLYGPEEYDEDDQPNAGTKYLGKTCFIGKPTHIELSAEQYQDVLEGNVSWTNRPVVSSQRFTFDSLGSAAFIVLNKSQTTVNTKFEGYYIGMIDNSNYNPATDFDGIRFVNGIQNTFDSTNNYVRLPSTRMNFSLTANKFGDGSTVSEVMENLSQFDLADRSFDDTISLGVVKLRQSVFSPDSIALDYVLNESYVGSIDYNRQIADRNGGPARSFSLERVTEDSPNIRIFINPFLSNRGLVQAVGSDGVPFKRVRFLGKQIEQPLVVAGNVDSVKTYVTRVGALSATVAELSEVYGYADSLFPIGIYNDTASVERSIGNLPKKLERAFELVENSDLYTIDLAIEAGLGTVYVNSVEETGTTDLFSASATVFTDNLPLKPISAFYVTGFDKLEEEGMRLRANYTAVANVFINMAQNQRKDFMVVLDPLRNIFVQGPNSKVINSKRIWSPNAGIDPNPEASNYVIANFSQHIYWPLRHQFALINTSYAATYANWVQVVDNATNRQVWVPFSGFAAATMARTDSNFQPWFAPAGFTRGIVSNANDLAIYPKQKQRDQLYKMSLNPVAFFPNEGFVVFGQKTMLKKPSAFDRINVRRLFLNLERATKNTAKFFVFEPNTLFTRTQVVNVLSPLFENAKNTEGLYDYRIICSELNNTPEVIDNNELKIDIYIQPVRTAEFILVNFYATRTGANFDEIIGA
jgi:hypothetical protein